MSRAPVMVVAGVAAAVASSGDAHATYSIVATDGATRQIGGAGTSCVGALSVRVIYGAVPGVGAVHAQAQLGGPGRDEAIARLGQAVAPADIIAAITDLAFDPLAPRRQYGIVDLQARAAGYSGAQNGAFAGDTQGQVGAFTYSIQGNILTSVAVLDHATTAFEGAGCDLADRLVLALEAGAAGGEGDSRCTVRGIPSDSAFVEVDRDGEAAGSYLRLGITNTAPASPLPLLRAQYDAWRATHPCPAPAPDAGVDPSTDDAAGCCEGSAGDHGASTGALVLAALLLVHRRR